MTPIKGYSLVFIPRSWALGVWRKPHKTIYAFGPLRFAMHRSLGGWKPATPRALAEQLSRHIAGV